MLLREIFESMGLPDGMDYLDKFYIDIDLDRNGLVTHDEFRNAILLKEIGSVKFVAEYILAWRGGSSQEKLDQVFGYLDRDKDGILTLEEIQVAFGENGNIYGKRFGNKDLQTIFHQVDTNNDGIVSKEDLWDKFSVLDNHALHSFHLTYLVASDLKFDEIDLDADHSSIIKIFYTVDTDSNGFISFGEFQTFCLDINKFDFVDKNLSMESVMTGFGAFDTNGDEKITWSEFLYGFQQNQKLAVVDAFLTISHDARRELSFREQFA